MLKWLMNMIVTSLLFFPEEDYWQLPKDLGLEAETVACVTQDGVRLSAWFLPASDAKATILYFHGNGGNISGRLFKVKGWIERGVSVFLLDYRGYGKSEGKITHERDLDRDAEAALGWLKESKKLSAGEIILYGESLGSAPAVELATREKFKGLILESPFVSIKELAKRHYPWAPSFLVRDFQFNNLEKIRNIQCPVFVLHGTDDDICPQDMGRRVFEQAPAPKEFFSVAGGSHNDLLDQAGEEYFDRPYRFCMG